ncbi:MAG: precorrin-6A reductase [Tissierellia bacterium]|nr:precorrin-6A reductase [Tissierellia bacterium]
MIWVIGGTTEARDFIDRLEGIEYVVSVATEEGREFLKGKNVFVGRMNFHEMEKFCLKKKISAIVDLSHPYARIVSENAKAISVEFKIPYFRYERPMLESPKGIDSFNRLEEMIFYMKDLEGVFLITLGSKNIKELVKVRGDNRFIFRVLPTEESIRSLRENEVEMKDIIASLGPFSYEQNLLTMKENRVDYLVTKNSGDKGGYEEKIRAAENLGVKILLLDRAPVESLSLEEIFEKIKEM